MLTTIKKYVQNNLTFSLNAQYVLKTRECKNSWYEFVMYYHGYNSFLMHWIV